ncbi:hypothetical protein [Azospirillum halopraeferens]|uniref:hypothetical protein n=1 Tax=Azospirillum halopraeferens TaxID=34010 RepID=UPI000407B30B|nr:hypothetical protein [Azospirillum halopraeferens]
MADDEMMKPEEANLAIERASAKSSNVQRMRERLQKLAQDDDKGLQILADAIRRMLRQ